MAEADRKRVVLGVDFGATNLKALLVDGEGWVAGRFIEPSESERGPAETLRRIVGLVQRGRESAEAASLELIAIGIGVCGPVDHARGELVESPVLPGWRDVPVRDTIADALDLPTHIENDGNAAILGEWWMGAGERRSVVAGLTLGTGIGGGLVIGGRVYRGAHGFGAEFGHIQIAPEPPCPCGGTGCLGRVASAGATVRRYRETAGRDALALDDVLEVGELARRGDPAAAEAIRFSADCIARASLNLINCLNPDTLVLTGGMALLGEALLAPIRAFVRASTFKKIADRTRIVAGSLGMYSGCFGSARLALSGGHPLPE